MQTDYDLIKLGAKKELANREFFFYCNLISPEFYKEDRQYLKDLCYEMQEFYFSDDDILIVNLPP